MKRSADDRDAPPTHAPRGVTVRPEGLPAAARLMAALQSVDFSNFYTQLLEGRSADRVIDLCFELKRFLVLKAISEDYKSTILSPTTAVDEAWHALMLNPVLYVSVCRVLTGSDVIIDHDPLGGRDAAARSERLKATEDLYRAVFGEDQRFVATNAAAPMKATVTVKEMAGKRHAIEVDTSISVEEFRSKFSEDSHIPEDQTRFIFNGRHLIDGNTLASYGVVDGSMVHMVLRMGGC